jgi:hypothetical protein
MRCLATSIVLTVLAGAAAPAQAALISPIDPVIGVRGERAGSPNVTDGSIFALSMCTEEELEGFFCAPYTNNVESLTSLDLSFWDVNGLPIPNTVEDNSNYFLPEGDTSDFQGLLNLGDGFTVRLCFDDDDPACQENDFLSLLSDSSENGGLPFSSLFVFSDQPGFVSIRAVNTTPNENLPPNDQPIPEPATLLLLGMGAAAVAGRRRTGRRAV